MLVFKRNAINLLYRIVVDSYPTNKSFIRDIVEIVKENTTGIKQLPQVCFTSIYAKLGEVIISY
jgi:hypothetical protein